MYAFTPATAVFLHKAPVDFRKQINGLALIVQESMLLNPMEEALFVFTNRQANRAKVLWWDKNGFCLWLKRLEKDRFIWPFAHDSEVLKLNGEQLSYLLAGLDIFKIPPHQRLSYGAVGS
ncbi:MAG TPA: IS66 family insertion sequence element accessory protein TnpB [Gammaproteobacteria bacterium]|nr:IS66 family insertion sequence element accessory protein TnpB [Gammaproteobacteria bacterium]